MEVEVEGEVEAVAAPEPSFSLAALASDRDRVLERLNTEASSVLTGLAIRDIRLTFPAEKISLSMYENHFSDFLAMMEHF